MYNRLISQGSVETYICNERRSIMLKSSTSHGHLSRYVVITEYNGFISVLHLTQNTLEHPDERQLSRGIGSTDVPAHLKSLVDALVWESARTEEGWVES